MINHTFRLPFPSVGRGRRPRCDCGRARATVIILFTLSSRSRLSSSFFYSSTTTSFPASSLPPLSRHRCRRRGRSSARGRRRPPPPALPAATGRVVLSSSRRHVVSRNVGSQRTALTCAGQRVLCVHACVRSSVLADRLAAWPACLVGWSAQRGAYRCRRRTAVPPRSAVVRCILRGAHVAHRLFRMADRTGTHGCRIVRWKNGRTETCQREIHCRLLLCSVYLTD